MAGEGQQLAKRPFEVDRARGQFPDERRRSSFPAAWFINSDGCQNWLRYRSAPASRRKAARMCRPCQKDGGIRSRKYLATCWKNADNKFRYAGVCKGRVFLASEKFNPVRECGPGFRKNLPCQKKPQ